MRIAHICLSSFFIDDRAYQENELVAEHVRQGHEVLVIASTQVHGPDGRRGFTTPGDYRTAEGARIIRLAYHPWIPRKLGMSLRIHRGVKALLERFSPDAIMFHGICGWELLTVARYARSHPQTYLVADTHTDFVNSARSFVSKRVLHYLYYRTILKMALPEIRKIFYISMMTRDFARDFYGVPDRKMEFLPLGGHPLPDDVCARRRTQTRDALGVDDNAIVMLQSGKQSSAKGLIETLRAFVRRPEPHLRLVIAGLLMDDIREEAERLIGSDTRIVFVGWTSAGDLTDLLCAADVYLQPKSQSSTMQTSLCCQCVVVLERLKGHDFYVEGNGWLLDDSFGIEDALARIVEAQSRLPAMRAASKALARENLDYAVLARRVLPDDYGAAFPVGDPAALARVRRNPAPQGDHHEC